MMANISKGARLYKSIPRLESLALRGVRHGCHVMFYSPVENVKLFDQIPITNTVLMQLRFDGRLGFPGGFVDATDKTLEDAVNREAREELGSFQDDTKVVENNYVVSHYCHQIRFCVHFFCKKIDFSDLLQLERRPEVPDVDGGFEVLGVVRVPLFNLRDNKGGFRAFMKNNFVGISKEQLIIGIKKNRLLSDAALEDFLADCPESYLLKDLRYENSA